LSKEPLWQRRVWAAVQNTMSPEELVDNHKQNIVRNTGICQAVPS
jgi:hypothetical protein